MRHILTVCEEDGFVRRSFPTAVIVRFPQGAWRSGDAFCLIGPDGKEAPCQIDACAHHPDGSVQTAEITFAPFLQPGETRRYALDTGGKPASAQVRNPISVDTGDAETTVRQGVIAYAVRHENFNIVNTTAFQDKAFLKPNAPGPGLELHTGEVLYPEGEVAVAPETRGPWSGRLRVAGRYPHGFTFETRLTFVSSKSWYLAEHRIVSGDRNRIRALFATLLFDLPGPLSSAFGARTTHAGMPTAWAVVTNGAHTVDVAALNAWTATDAVRFEADPDGRFRMRFSGDACRFYVHVLHGPPDDITNTPAPAMAAGLRCIAESDSNANVTTS